MSELLTEQLQLALNSRVSIEQAEGVLAASAPGTVSMDEAFALSRTPAAHPCRMDTGLLRMTIAQNDPGPVDDTGMACDRRG